MQVGHEIMFPASSGSIEAVTLGVGVSLDRLSLLLATPHKVHLLEEPELR